MSLSTYNSLLLESLTFDYEDLEPLATEEKQPHIDGKELKRKKKRKCFETVSN